MEGADKPYSPEHKVKTRARIVECARPLFNRKRFTEVSIDEIMAAPGLTRVGIYNYFIAKEEFYVETLATYAQGRREFGETITECGPAIVWQMIIQ